MHQVFRMMPSLAALPLIAAIKGHLFYSRMDPQVGEFSIILPMDQKVAECLRWVASRAQVGPGCSILYRSVDFDRLQFVPEFLEYELVLGNVDS